jgi:imidazolonepropionase-like amidohydrolase
MNKTFIAAILAGGTLIAVGVAGSKPEPSANNVQESGTFVIRNVRVFDGEKTLPPTDVIVRNGVIASVGTKAPSVLEAIDGTGRTLLPGLIDAHTHAFGDALERALVFGVTTELDMFTDHSFAAAMRKQQREPGGASKRADLFSAGTLVTAPGGHGTEYGMKIPTLTSPADAEAFVAARIAEGSDYIKIVYDSGAAYQLKMPSIDRETLGATIAAVRKAGKLAVVHIGSQASADDALAAGASGLIHLFEDSPPAEDFTARVKKAGAFITPTLTVLESATSVPSGASLVDDRRMKSLITPVERANLGASFPKRANSRLRIDYAFAATKSLHDAGVPILAGTDAPNPGTAHGSSIHRELELLVKAGLTPEAALAAATSVPARVFALNDRGRIAKGMRADLVLVSGNPAEDITATRDIVQIWKGGVRADRPVAGTAPAVADAATTTGIVSTFDKGEPSVEFGTGWQISTDSMMGGKSEAAMTVVANGANNTAGALEVSGTVAAGAMYPWAGAMFFPDKTPMTPVNLSRFKEIVFWARGDGGQHQLMVFASRLGDIPVGYTFRPGKEWKEFVVPFSQFSGIDGSDIKGILFSAGAKPGPFRFAIDEVRFR